MGPGPYPWYWGSAGPAITVNAASGWTAPSSPRGVPSSSSANALLDTSIAVTKATPPAPRFILLSVPALRGTADADTDRRYLTAQGAREPRCDRLGGPCS